MAELVGGVGELNLTISITRKETGKVEEYQLVGFVNEEQLEAFKAESAAQSTSEEK